MIPKMINKPISMISDSKNKQDLGIGKSPPLSGAEKENFKHVLDESSERTHGIKKQFREVSDLYEKQFLREMLKSMRSTVSESGLIKTNQAEKIFREQLDHEYVEKWGAKGGIGLSDIIYNNMMDRFGEKLGLKETVARPKGPLAIKENDTYQIRAVATKNPDSQAPAAVQYLLKDIKKSDSTPVRVQQPWSGYLTKKIQLAPDEYFLEMNHENGLKSQMHFKGSLLEINESNLIQEGRELGSLSPDANSFSWLIKK